MGIYDSRDFSDLIALSGDEVVTHSYVRDVTLASGKVLALVTLDNNRDYTRPSTLGPVGLLELDNTLLNLAARAAAGEIHAVAVTGKQYVLAAGADLSKIGRVPTRAASHQIGELGHQGWKYRLRNLGDI